MFHYFNNLVNAANGNALPGYLVYVLDAGGTIIPIYSDESGTPIQTVSDYENAAITDAEGNYDLYVDDGTYSLQFRTITGSILDTIVNVPMISNVALVDLSADDGATLVGTASGDTVQQELDAKVAVVDLAASAGSAGVGFLQSGTDAVARTVQDKGRDNVSVLDFIPPHLHAGIRAETDTTDLTEYFEAAFATGKEVFAPRGQYHGNISMPIGSKMFGEGVELTTFRNFGDSPAITISSAAADIVRVTIQGMTIRNRDKTVYTNADGIYIDGSTPGRQNDLHRFSDLLIFQFRYNVFITGRSIWNGWTHCSFVEAIRDGFRSDADENQALQEFNTCRFAANGQHGLSVDHNFANFLLDAWTFTNCTFENNLWVPIHIGGTFGIQNWTFIGCYGEENCRGIAPGSTGGVVKSGFLQINAPYAVGLKLSNCTMAGNTAPEADPDYYVYVADTCINVIGRIDNCRGDTAAIIGVYWKRGLDLGLVFNLTYDIDRALSSRAASESMSPTTFTPGLAFSGGSTGITYAANGQIGRYTINGGVVTFQAYISLSSKGSSTGAVRLTGLPLPGRNVTNLLQSVQVIVGETPTTMTQIGGQISPGNSYVEVIGIASTALAAMADTDISNTSTFRISGSYYL